MSSKKVWVEISGEGVPVRIFRNKKAWVASGCGEEDSVEMVKAAAVFEIRAQVYIRQEGLCLNCKDPVKWDGSLFERAHLHEKISKGKGGEVSLTNCIILCCDCHLNGAHGDRKPQFGVRKADDVSRP